MLLNLYFYDHADVIQFNSNVCHAHFSKKQPSHSQNYYSFGKIDSSAAFKSLRTMNLFVFVITHTFI